MSLEPLPPIFPIRPSILFTDVDETLTWDNRLPLEAFTALDKLKSAGVRVVPVTGASAGWCDCMIRTWPIDSIIGENGSFSIDRNKEGGFTQKFALSVLERKQNWDQLQKLKQTVLENYSIAYETADQAFRLTDIAFDIGQDRKVSRERAEEIASYCSEAGFESRMSSIHINVWKGRYSKSTMALDWLKDNKIERDKAIFIGDSPNDESMFNNFEVTVGVANILPYIDELASCPQYVTSKPGGFGFSELADSILRR